MTFQYKNAMSIIIAATTLATFQVFAQESEDNGEQVEQTPREAAPNDLTGYWTSVITEDWRWRMVTPPKGDYVSMPLNEEGIRVADSWDPESSADDCRPYGAAGLMRMPIRIFLEWEDENTLRLDTDHGLQTRYFHFDSGEIGDNPPSLQGDSFAQWEGASLKVLTTNMTPGYLRRNGVPYSADAVLTEYFDFHESYDEQWITVSAFVEDPVYLTETFFTSSSFKSLANGDSWYPQPCGEN